MSIISDIVTSDAAYLSACVERFRGAEDGNIRIPLASAEALLRNYVRLLGQDLSTKATAQATTPEATMMDLVAKMQSWTEQMKLQQEAAMAAMRPSGLPASTFPTSPPTTGASQ